MPASVMYLTFCGAGLPGVGVEPVQGLPDGDWKTTTGLSAAPVLVSSKAVLMSSSAYGVISLSNGERPSSLLR